MLHFAARRGTWDIVSVLDVVSVGDENIWRQPCCSAAKSTVSFVLRRDDVGQFTAEADDFIHRPKIAGLRNILHAAAAPV
jgi:hypothetical protein